MRAGVHDHPPANSRGGSVPVLAQRPRAAADFVEWGPFSTAEQQFGILAQNPVTLDALIQRSPATPALQDDRPINEYYLLRTHGVTYHFDAP